MLCSLIFIKYLMNDICFPSLKLKCTNSQPYPLLWYEADTVDCGKFNGLACFSSKLKNDVKKINEQLRRQDIIISKASLEAICALANAITNTTCLFVKKNQVLLLNSTEPFRLNESCIFLKTHDSTIAYISLNKDSCKNHVIERQHGYKRVKSIRVVFNCDGPLATVVEKTTTLFDKAHPAIIRRMSLMKDLKGCPNLLRDYDVIEYCDNSRKLSIFSEWLSKDVREELPRVSKKLLELDVRGRLRILIQFLEALVFMHNRNITHLNMSLNNCFLIKKRSQAAGLFLPNQGSRIRLRL